MEQVPELQQLWEALGISLPELAAMVTTVFLAVKAFKTSLPQLQGWWTILVAVALAAVLGYVMIFKPELGLWGKYVALVVTVFLLASGLHGATKKKEPQS